MANVVHNPGIPYVAPIPGGIHDGMQIHVSGIPEHHHNGFLISLQAGGSIDPRSECAFVFNPRFTDNQVVRNSLQGGAWGMEERHGGFPFHRGQRCDVTIHIKPHHYSVSVNGHHFCDYNHRLQKHRVTHITVEQGIKVNTIRFDGKHVPGHRGRHGHHGAGAGIGAAMGRFAGALANEFSHATQPTQHPYPGQPHHGGGGYPSSGAPIYNPPVPFVHNTGGLYPGKMIFISGIPNPNPSRFTIYLQQGLHHEPHEIAMCFDARFGFMNDRNVIVQNHKQGNWGAEERRAPYFPFAPNGSFDLIILVEANGFKVAVNNQHLVEFFHRIQPLNRIDTLRVDGDVRLTQVRFQG